MKAVMTLLLVASAVTFASSALADVIPPASDAGDAAASTGDSGSPTTTRVDSGTTPIADDKGGCSFGASPIGSGSAALLIAGALILARRRRPAA